MKNPNAPANRLRSGLKERWLAADHPGGEARFQIALFAKDLAIFVLLPVAAVFLFKACEKAMQAPKKPRPVPQQSRNSSQMDSKSQIIEFRSGGGAVGVAGGFARKSPGTLVRVKLMNVVETYSTAPVHAQIVDYGLGTKLAGGTLIGDATPDSNYERITISFRFARDPARDNVALGISARALGLDGTLGLVASKKEGFVTRSALGSASAGVQEVQGQGGSQDFSKLLLKALTAGLIKEFGSATQVEQNRAQVLTLTPGTEFFAELTDFFPGAAK